jgi:hypothetical protein
MQELTYLGDRKKPKSSFGVILGGGSGDPQGVGKVQVDGTAWNADSDAKRSASNYIPALGGSHYYYTTVHTIVATTSQLVLIPMYVSIYGSISSIHFLAWTKLSQRKKKVVAYLNLAWTSDTSGSRHSCQVTCFS